MSRLPAITKSLEFHHHRRRHSPSNDSSSFFSYYAYAAAAAVSPTHLRRAVSAAALLFVVSLCCFVLYNAATSDNRLSALSILVGSPNDVFGSSENRDEKESNCGSNKN